MTSTAFRIFTAAFVCACAATASAVPIISVDLDPSTPGIQATRTVTAGTSFMVDFVFTGDGGAAFDAFGIDAGFNDSGPILGLGPMGPTAGSLAATAPILALDAFTFGAVGPSSVLTPSAAIPTPPPGFAGGTGQVGILSAAVPFGGAPFGAGTVIDMFSVDFVASMVGSSTILGVGFPAPGAIPPAPAPGSPGIPGAFEIALGGVFVPVTLESGLVTVTPAGTVPEPGTWLLLGAGLAGLVLGRRRAQAREK